MKKAVLKLLVGSLCISALAGIIIILLGFYGKISSMVLGTTLTIFGFSITGLCSSTLYEKENLKLFSLIGMLTSFISCLYFICLVWGIIDFDFFEAINWKLIATTLLLPCSSAHISLILLINNKNKIVSNFRLTTVIFSVIIDVMLLLSIWNAFDVSELYVRLLWVLAILITLGTIVTPILNKVYKTNEPEASNG